MFQKELEFESELSPLYIKHIKTAIFVVSCPPICGGFSCTCLRTAGKKHGFRWTRFVDLQ